MATVYNPGNPTQQPDSPTLRKIDTLPAYSIAQLPSAAKNKYGQVYVTDTSKPAYSDGTAWKYADGAAV